MCWKVINCSRRELNLALVLNCGQSFRWKQLMDDQDVWLGVLSNKLWFLKQDDVGNIFYKTSVNGNSSVDTINVDQQQKDDSLFLKDYFQLNIKIEKLYERWGKSDPVFNGLSSSFGGVRILRQDPVENLFTFICSQNNNISRITQLVEKLCQNYGQVVASYDGKDFYSFPSISSLANDSVEGELRQLGFGYRAKFIYKTSKSIIKKPEGVEWLRTLRLSTYQIAREQLRSLPGVGSKVADCVCLMSLDKHDAIPIDTHIWQVAVRDYLPHLKKNKTITDRAYKEIGDYLREQFGEYAGWAQSVLFSSELRKFQSLKNHLSTSTSASTISNKESCNSNRKRKSEAVETIVRRGVRKKTK